MGSDCNNGKPVPGKLGTVLLQLRWHHGAWVIVVWEISLCLTSLSTPNVRSGKGPIALEFLKQERSRKPSLWHCAGHVLNRIQHLFRHSLKRKGNAQWGRSYITHFSDSSFVTDLVTEQMVLLSIEIEVILVFFFFFPPYPHMNPQHFRVLFWRSLITCLNLLEPPFYLFLYF